MENTVVNFASFESVIDALTAQISVANVVGVLAAVVGACVGLAFMWWGVRYATAKLMKAFKSGRV